MKKDLRDNDETISNSFLERTDGQDLVEYALIVAAIALGLIAAVRGVTTALNSLYESITAALALTGQ